jgi:hypothetical protein
VKADVGEVLVGEEVESLEGAVGREVLSGNGGGEKCSEEDSGSEIVEAHGICMQCKTWAG